MPIRLTRTQRAFALAGATAALLNLGACATQDDIQPVQGRLSAQRLGLTAPEAPASAPLSDMPAWWASLGDARLDALVQQALQDHPNLQAAAARLRRTEAGQMRADSAASPQVQAKAEVDRQHFSAHGLYPPPIAGGYYSSGTLQLESSWELDLFGKHRAQLDAAVGQVKAAQADVVAARWVLSTQVVRTYVQLGRLQAQRGLAERALAQRNEMTRLVQQREKQGLDTRVEVRQSEGALPETRNQIEALDEQIALTRHALAVLTGQAPTALDDLQVKLDALQLPEAPAQLPLDLLSRRPDVTAALWRAQAANRTSRVTRVALFYPNIELRSYAGYNAIGLDNLLKGSSQQWGLMPAITLPLFDGDARRSAMLDQVSQEDLAIASYNQVVQQAAQEAVDQLTSVQAVARQQDSQRQAQAHVEAAYDLARSRYQAGLGNYLVVLNAETAVLAQRRAAVDLTTRALDARIGLIRAMAGGAAQAAQAATSQPAS
jgi:NodT family efflux transporter outer membrane factor (OMF) lipoprotein